MKVKEYYKFVEDTAYYTQDKQEEQMDIALYGLVGEIGSLITEIKKQLLAPDQKWNHPTPDIIEELGDVLWYCFAFLLAYKQRPFDILAFDLRNLQKEIGAEDNRSRAIHRTLSTKRANQFLAKSKQLLKQKNFTFQQYQNTAFLTARTANKELLEVCLAVLQQLGAQLMRSKLPPIEIKLNKEVIDRPTDKIVGEIIWHISALARLYGITLTKVLQENEDKISDREVRTAENRTPLHDLDVPAQYKLPRRMEIAFVKISRTKARMYKDGKPLGDDLTDNVYREDGYRFHDVMHLAHAAYLGWSPVLRKLLGLKRKHKNKIDEVEDGARAGIVEEAVLKIVHSEGTRADELLPRKKGEIRQLFPERSKISNGMLKSIRNLVKGLEAYKNRYWEWEEAITNGHKAFYDLRVEEQGTINIDLNRRELSFSPHVFMEIHGGLINSGIGEAESRETKSIHQWMRYLTDREQAALPTSQRRASLQMRRLLACKRACLNSLGIKRTSAKALKSVEISFGQKKNQISVKVSGQVREEMWAQEVITFRLDLTEAQNKSICVSAAIGDIETPSND